MNYQKTFWIHNYEDKPVLFYHESDEDDYIVRSIEIFADGELGLASEEFELNGTMLPEKTQPDIDTANANPDLRVFVISKEQFEIIWEKGIALHKSHSNDNS